MTALREVMLEEKSIYLVFEYAEHDFLVRVLALSHRCWNEKGDRADSGLAQQIIHHHSSTRTQLPLGVLKSLLWQLFNGVSYLHDNWIIHRDLKPANILVNEKGQVKIGDLGLARLYQEPLQSLYTSDKVPSSPWSRRLAAHSRSSIHAQIVVTVWYRSPELLLGARHYTPAIDMWSMGCIYGELLGLRPMFKGEEAKIELGAKKGGVPFQRDQLTRVLEVLGTIDRASRLLCHSLSQGGGTDPPSSLAAKQWPGVMQLPEYTNLSRLERCVKPRASLACAFVCGGGLWRGASDNPTDPLHRPQLPGLPLPVVQWPAASWRSSLTRLRPHATAPHLRPDQADHGPGGAMPRLVGAGTETARQVSAQSARLPPCVSFSRSWPL